jgi:NADH:ubiquinone oxidoreductase subunit 3 (subunit A)
MTENILLSPPLAFLIVLAAMLLLVLALTRLAFKPKGHTKGEIKAYACGEDMPSHMIQPDYSQFFPFAFYFTILHVVALMAATVPAAVMGTYVIAVVYILGAIIGLCVLYRR